MSTNGVVNSMQVAIVEPVGGHGGMDYYDFGLISGLAAAGVNGVLYTCDETTRPERAVDLHVGFNRIYGGSSRWVRAVRYVRGLCWSLVHARRHGSRLVHFHFFHGSAMELLTVSLARLLGFGVVVTAHDVASFSGDGSLTTARRVYAKAHAVIAHNEVTAKELVDVVGVDASVVSVVPHGSYVDAIKSNADLSQARELLGIEQDARVLLFFGQIKAVKGLDLLIEALPRVIESGADVRLIVAGKVWKDDFSTYHDMISRLSLEGHVRLDIRYIDEDEAELYYIASDLIVLPYRRIYQSGVLLMAMSHAKAVVASDLPGMAEVVTDGVDGYLFRQGDSVDLARVIIRALDDPSSPEVARRGRDLMNEKFGWSRIGLLTRKVYEDALQQRG